MHGSASVEQGTADDECWNVVTISREPAVVEAAAALTASTMLLE
jgi:hypothetical protein